LSLSLLLLLAPLSALAVACGSDQDVTAPPITASVLVEPAEGGETWFRGVSVPRGTNGHELLEAAVDGELEAVWYAEFRSHFVGSVLGIEPTGSQFWGVFVWDQGISAWSPLPVGADLFSVKEGHIMGWALVEFDPDSPQVPASTP
jgi:hypothetical protein